MLNSQPPLIVFLLATLLTTGCEQNHQNSISNAAKSVTTAPTKTKLETIVSTGDFFDVTNLSKPDVLRDELIKLKEPIKGEFQKTQEFEASLIEHRTRMKANGYGDGSLYAIPLDISSYNAKYDADEELFEVKINTSPSFNVACVTPKQIEYCEVLSLHPSNEDRREIRATFSTPLKFAEEQQASLEAVYFIRFEFTNDDLESKVSLVNSQRSTSYERATNTVILNSFINSVEKKDYRSTRHRYLKTVFDSDVIIAKLETVALRDTASGTILWTHSFDDQLK